MFVEFFYLLRAHGVPVVPTAFLKLQEALASGLVLSMDDLYSTARALLVKRVAHFDIYDRLFAHHFEGKEYEAPEEELLDDMARLLLEEWLRAPEEVARALGVDPGVLSGMTPQEVIEYFEARLREQTEAHHGGNRWIGTGGTSPVGHSGVHPGGMRVGGSSGNKSAVKVALERRYRDYTKAAPLTKGRVGEALRGLRRMVPEGPRDVVNVDETIRRTLKNAGEIEITFDRSLRDRLKIYLLIDNGGWSMDPYIPVVQTLFDYARYQFKELETFYFHNTVYDTVWAHPSRRRKPLLVDALLRKDPDTRLVFVGDASMAPYELMGYGGTIYYGDRSTKPSIERLRELGQTFSKTAWLNPVLEENWRWTFTIGEIRAVVPMFPLTIEGLEQMVTHLS